MYQARVREKLNTSGHRDYPSIQEVMGEYEFDDLPPAVDLAKRLLRKDTSIDLLRGDEEIFSSRSHTNHKARRDALKALLTSFEEAPASVAEEPTTEILEAIMDRDDSGRFISGGKKKSSVGDTLAKIGIGGAAGVAAGAGAHYAKKTEGYKDLKNAAEGAIDKVKGSKLGKLMKRAKHAAPSMPKGIKGMLLKGGAAGVAAGGIASLLDDDDEDEA